MTASDLPKSVSGRWTARRKAEVVSAIEDGVLSFHEAAARYRLTGEELQGWQTTLKRHGLKALGATRVQKYDRP
ncbi:DUF1153 domain-containing protein [Lichenihabitans psoromatis]|uniref:DUF1153 domain-containing protein n=1 Tax=Lichenihabitans psoromatis TaxID=2528642 RepID=UPI003CCAB1AD